MPGDGCTSATDSRSKRWTLTDELGGLNGPLIEMLHDASTTLQTADLRSLARAVQLASAMVSGEQPGESYVKDVDRVLAVLEEFSFDSTDPYEGHVLIDRRLAEELEDALSSLSFGLPAQVKTKNAIRVVVAALTAIATGAAPDPKALASETLDAIGFLEET